MQPGSHLHLSKDSLRNTQLSGPLAIAGLPLLAQRSGPASVTAGLLICGLTALRISGRRTRELAHGDDCPLQPLDGLARQRRDRKRMVIRSADGEARSVRAIDQAHRRQWSAAELPSGAAPCWAVVFIFKQSVITTKSEKAPIKYGPTKNRLQVTGNKTK